MNKCHLNNSINCEYSTICSKWSKWIKDYKNFIYFNNLISSYSLENFELLKYLIINWYRKSYLNMWGHDNLENILSIKKKLSYNFIWFSKKIVFNSDYGFWIFYYLNWGSDYFWLYPSCCVDNFNYVWWDNLYWNSYFTSLAFSNSDFFCPLLFPIVYWKSNLDFNFMPWYKFHSFDCDWTIKYMHWVLKYFFSRNIITKDIFFNFISLPFLITKNKIILFDWYYEDWNIFYSWFFNIDFWEFKETIFLSRSIKLTYLSSKNVNLIYGSKNSKYL